MLSAIRRRRGVSQRVLYKVSGVSDATIRAAEQQIDSVRASTVRSLLSALVTYAPLVEEEIELLSRELGWDHATLRAINAHHAVKIPTESDRRRTARSRINAVLEDHDLVAEQLADLVEAAARFASASVARAIQDDLADPATALAGQIGRDLAVLNAVAEEVSSPRSDPHLHRVVLPPERRSDGAVVERFEYYTPDGRRLVPAPKGAHPEPDPKPAAKPRAKPLRPREDPGPEDPPKRSAN